MNRMNESNESANVQCRCTMDIALRSSHGSSVARPAGRGHARFYQAISIGLSPEHPASYRNPRSRPGEIYPDSLKTRLELETRSSAGPWTRSGVRPGERV